MCAMLGWILWSLWKDDADDQGPYDDLDPSPGIDMDPLYCTSINTKNAILQYLSKMWLLLIDINYWNPQDFCCIDNAQ